MRTIIFTLTLFCTMYLGITVAATPKILIVESYHSGYDWDKSYIEGFKKTLGNRYQVETFEMDTKRIPRSLFARHAEQAWEKIQQFKPQLVVLGDDNALKYLGPKLVDGPIPVVYLGINNNPDDYVPRNRNLTGILERPLFDFNFDTIAKLIKPRPRKVLVLFDSGTTSRASVSEAFKNKTRLLAHDMEIELNTIGMWELWQQTVTGAKERGFDAIVVGLYHTLRDANGNSVPAEDVITWTAKNSPLPPFGFWDFSVGIDKTIGGFVLSGYEQGKAAARVAQKILNGTDPATIAPTIGENGQFVFSKSQLNKYHIDLPETMRKKTHWLE